MNTSSKPKFDRRLLLVIGGSLLLICLVCGVISTLSSRLTPKPTPDVGAIYTQVAGTVLANANSTAVVQSAETVAAKPTETQMPTLTSTPTATATQPPQPVTLQGTGDSVVDVTKWDGPALLHAKHTGYANFAVWNYGSDNQKIDLLVNTIGNYEGFMPLDFSEGENTTRLEVKADGQWQFEILPLQMVPSESVPTTVQQVGDFVFSIHGGTPDLLKAQSNSDSNFVVYGYSKSGGKDLLVNEIAPYSGTVMLQPDTFLIVVKAEGPWTMEIATK